MKVNIFPIVSSLHEHDRINKETTILLEELKKVSNNTFDIVSLDKLYEGDLALILIQSGGSEQLFLKHLKQLKPPYYLLTYGHNNSLAASMEVLSYLKDRNLDGQIIHGNNTQISFKIEQLLKKDNDYQYRYGVIGKPSDWLIASNVNYKQVEKVLNVKLIDIPISELVEQYKNIKSFSYHSQYDFEYDKKELNNAKKLDVAIKNIKDKYNLNGLTIRCFDLLGKIKTTACLSMSLLNSSNIVATCEGDIPTMLSMHIVNKLFNQTGFQANPSRIDINSNKMVFAHCTLPLSMCKSYHLNTHFESNIGIAIKGDLKEEEITIFKLSNNLKDYFVTTGKILQNLNESNLCRSQIEISVDDNIEYFLNRPYGNHHIIIYGNHKQEIIDFMKSM